jgi:CheY-like chemotaxis protein
MPAEHSSHRVPAARLLVVDDLAHERFAVARALSNEFDVSLASPVLALERIRAGERYDVILCEVQTRPLNGIELLARIVSFNSGQAARFVFMTGPIYEASLRAQVDALSHVVLARPLNLASFRSLVRRRARRAAARAAQQHKGLKAPY